MIFGYLDPVTGSALVQAGLAGLAAVGLGWQYVRKGARTVWTKFHDSSPSETGLNESGPVESETLDA